MRGTAVGKQPWAVSHLRSLREYDMFSSPTFVCVCVFDVVAAIVLFPFNQSTTPLV